jgi:signal transduction histidine kinase
VGFRIVGGSILFLCGVLTLSVRSYGWAAVFLVPAALNFAFAYWELTIFYRLLAAPLPRRIRELEQSRARLVDDSAARLRQIERDLHDGAQAQMVAVAMKLSSLTSWTQPSAVSRSSAVWSVPMAGLTRPPTVPRRAS